MPRSTRKDASQNRAALLAAAREAFGSDAEASLDDIAERAGLTRRSLYAHFPSRDHLLDGMLVETSERMTRSMASWPQEDPLLRLVRVGGWAWQERASLQALGILSARAALRPRVVDALAPLMDSLLQTIREGRERGELRPDLTDIEMLRMLRGGLLIAIDEVTRNPTSDERDRRLVIRTVLATVGVGWREAELALSASDGAASPRSASRSLPPRRH